MSNARKRLLDVTNSGRWESHLDVYVDRDDIVIQVGTGCEGGEFYCNVEDFAPLAEAFGQIADLARQYLEETKND